MSETDIFRIDLNLLKAFVVLMETGNVTAAGEKLGIAQSSMSHTLRRLRDIFQDELFVRSTHGMIPTALATHVSGDIAAALVSLQVTLDTHANFDPKTSSRQFKVLMTDVVELMILPKLLLSLNSQAPAVRLSVVQYPRTQYREALETAVADIALGQLPDQHVDFYQQQLFESTFVCVMRNGHPLSTALDLNSFLAAQHLVIESPAVSEKLIKRALGQKAAQRHITCRIPHYLVAPYIIAATNLIAVLPRPLIEEFVASQTLIEMPLPFDVSPVEFRQYWHRRTHLDPGCVWLRRLIASQFQR